MTVKEDTAPTRTELTGAQRALLDERLKRAKQVAATRGAETRPSIPRRTTNDNLPLSFAQQRLWFLDQLEPGSPVYNLCQALRIRGPLNPALLESALNVIVQRHEALRTNFVSSEGQPVQVIVPQRTLSVTAVDLPGASEAVVEQHLREECRRAFDLAHDPLIRAMLVRTGTTEHTLLLTLHHIISDGWSMGVLFRELFAAYDQLLAGGTVTLPDLPIQYADYVLWEREALEGAALDKPLAFWREQLKGPLPVLELPVDRARPATPTNRGGARSIEISRALTQALKALSHREGGTLFMTLLAAFQVLLHRLSGQDDILVGSVVAGRRKVELEKLIGFFVNTLVFRGDLGGQPTFRELLVRTREAALAVLAHQDMPFERLVNEVRPDRTVSRNPLFQVMFVLQNAPMAPANVKRLELDAIEVDSGTSKFDLTLSLNEGANGMTAAIEYNADLFEPATIAQMLDSYHTLLEAVVANPDTRIGELPLLTASERQKILQQWNDTATDFPRTKTIAELFELEARRAPGAPAVVFDGARLTYAELDANANQLARWLRRRGVAAGTRVAVSMERSLELIVALVGIVKAGGTYVSLDPSYPAERLAFMMEDIAAPVLLTHRKCRARVDAVVKDGGRPDGHGNGQDRTPLSACTVISLDSEWSQIARESSAPLATEITPESVAYISYTSGSTGRPKGVCVPHRGVVRLVKNTNFARFGADEVFLQFAPVAFDASTLEIWGALLNGARLVVYPPGPSSLAEIGEFIERTGITTLWLTAGLFHQLVEEQVDRLKNVRQLLAGGDVLSPSHVARVLERLPRTRLINGYGPTENTTFTCCHEIASAPAGRSIPIGRPIANTQVYILDCYQQPVPVGVAGELYTGGDGLATGYLNRPELTADRFVVNPFVNGPSLNSQPSTLNSAPAARMYRTGDRARWLPDGTIEFLGRVDRQVKIRGFRVEPAEVENVLAKHPAVKECAVVVRDGSAGDKRLVAYFAPAQRPAPTTEVLRGYLAERLPEYLVPAGFVTIDVLPLNANGKVDVAALPADDGVRPDLQGQYAAPRDDVERKLVEIWETVLSVRPIGIHDQFFALGGHSLLAVRMISQLEKAFGHKLPVAAIFQHRTVEQLARLLRAPDRPYAAGTSVVEIHGQGTRPRLYLVHGVGGGMFWGYANLSRHLGNDQPLFAFKSRGLDGLPELSTIEEIAASYVADLRQHQPEGPYYLGGYCFGGIVAYEMARQLRQQRQEVAMLALINGSPPNTGYQKGVNLWSPAWQLKFLGNFAYWLSCFAFRWTWRERKEFVRWKFRVMRRKSSETSAQKQPEVALGDIDQLVDLAAYSDERRGLWRAHVKALINYRPGRYDGRVTLFRTRGHPFMCSFDYRYGWAELAEGGVEVKVVRGGHGNVLAEPYVQSVARALAPCLADLAAGQKEVTS